MKDVRVWFVNDLQMDGMPGDSRYFRTEAEAKAALKSVTWQRMGSFQACEIDGEVYRSPRKIDFD